MQVYAAINCSTDRPYWVSRDVFYDRFDQSDFMNRNVENVTPAYLQDWFYEDVDGEKMFYIPVVAAIGTRTDLVSSRHRLAVILPYLEELPFAFAFGNLTPQARAFLDSLPKRPLETATGFWLPDLPVCEKLP